MGRRRCEDLIADAQPFSERANHVLVSVNPKAGSGKRQAQVDQLVHSLTDRQMTTEVFTDLDQLNSRARELHQSQRLRVVVHVDKHPTSPGVYLNPG